MLGCLDREGAGCCFNGEEIDQLEVEELDLFWGLGAGDKEVRKRGLDGSVCFFPGKWLGCGIKMESFSYFESRSMHIVSPVPYKILISS